MYNLDELNNNTKNKNDDNNEKNNKNPHLDGCLANKIVNGWERAFMSSSDSNQTDHAHHCLSQS